MKLILVYLKSMGLVVLSLPALIFLSVIFNLPVEFMQFLIFATGLYVLIFFSYPRIKEYLKEMENSDDRK